MASSGNPFEFSTGTVGIGDNQPVPVGPSWIDCDWLASGEAFTAGSLEVRGVIQGTFTPDPGALPLFPPTPPRYDVKFAYPEDADRHCPVCHEPAEAVVMESMTMCSWPPVDEGGGWVTQQIAGDDPAAYRCEPCGHRFDRDGAEIERD